MITSFALDSPPSRATRPLVSNPMSPDLLYTSMMAWPASTASSVTASKSTLSTLRSPDILEDFSRSALAPSERLKKNGLPRPLCYGEMILSPYLLLGVPLKPSVDEVAVPLNLLVLGVHPPEDRV